MLRSIINDQNLLSRDFCTVSIAHDINARDRDYYNGFIILERLNAEGASLINLFELVVEEKGQVKINHLEFSNVEALKEVMAKKDCYAYSFDISSADADTLIKNISIDSGRLEQKSEGSGTYTRVKKPGLFSASILSDDAGNSTSFEWARSQALRITSLGRKLGERIPGGIDPFTKVAEHIGNLSHEKGKCLVM